MYGLRVKNVTIQIKPPKMGSSFSFRLCFSMLLNTKHFCSVLQFICYIGVLQHKSSMVLSERKYELSLASINSKKNKFFHSTYVPKHHPRRNDFSSKLRILYCRTQCVSAQRKNWTAGGISAFIFSQGFSAHFQKFKYKKKKKLKRGHH